MHRQVFRSPFSAEECVPSVKFPSMNSRLDRLSEAGMSAWRTNVHLENIAAHEKKRDQPEF